MANTEIFLRNIFGTTRPNIRPLVLALNITNDLLFEQLNSISPCPILKQRNIFTPMLPDCFIKSLKLCTRA